MSRANSPDAPAEVSPDLYALLLEKLDSLEKLELVLALRSAGTPQTLADLALQLRVGTKALRRVADAVLANGVIEPYDTERLWLCAGPWDPLLDDAARIYARDPVTLMRAFTRIAMEKLRGLSALTFAEAFRLPKKDGSR